MDFSDPQEASSQGPGLWPEYSSDEERSCSSPSEMEVLDDPAREVREKHANANKRYEERKKEARKRRGRGRGRRRGLAS
jgi:hypothetical protein